MAQWQESADDSNSGWLIIYNIELLRSDNVWLISIKLAHEKNISHIRKLPIDPPSPPNPSQAGSTESAKPSIATKSACRSQFTCSRNGQVHSSRLFLLVQESNDALTWVSMERWERVWKKSFFSDEEERIVCELSWSLDSRQKFELQLLLLFCCVVLFLATSEALAAGRAEVNRPTNSREIRKTKWVCVFVNHKSILLSLVVYKLIRLTSFELFLWIFGSAWEKSRQGVIH